MFWFWNGISDLFSIIKLKFIHRGRGLLLITTTSTSTVYHQNYIMNFSSLRDLNHDFF